jgi:hypothetical protein
MATIREEYELLKMKILAGKENETIHVVWTDQDRKRKRANVGPKQQTRFSIDCGSPDLFKDLYAEYDRLISTIENKTITIDMIVWWLRLLTPERIQKKLKAGTDAGPRPAVIPSEDWIEGRDEPGLNEIPEWLRE